jgi:hypothetical protein
VPAAATVALVVVGAGSVRSATVRASATEMVEATLAARATVRAPCEGWRGRRPSRRAATRAAPSPVAVAAPPRPDADADADVGAATAGPGAGGATGGCAGSGARPAMGVGDMRMLLGSGSHGAPPTCELAVSRRRLRLDRT